MVSRRLMILAAVAVLGSAWFIFFKDRNDFIWIFSVGLLILMISYVFQFQIDQLMMRGVPQRIPRAMDMMLSNTAAWYANADEQVRRLIGDRMQRWIMRKDFINKNDQDAPEDVKYILAYYASLLTLQQEEFSFKNIDRIAFYHHPFLSPSFPDDAHISELEKEDGTIIISVPHLLKGHLEKGYYNIGLHVMAEAFAHEYLKENIQWPEDIWNQLESISNISRDALEAYIGLPVNDPWPVAVHHQVTYVHPNIKEVLHFLPHLAH